MYPAQDIKEEESRTIEIYCFPCPVKPWLHIPLSTVAETLNMKLQYRSHYGCNEKAALCD
jgi:hypothetical protein